MNKNLERILAIDLPAGQSAFLWGPRKTGKSTYLKQRFPECPYFDFLKDDLYLELGRTPSRFREQLLSQVPAPTRKPVILDEVQKVPALLDEVHWLIENKKFSFILCGSSARKLKRGHANLLGGRAWRFEMFPLTSKELGQVELLRALNHGLIPSHYLQDDESARRSLRAYLTDYLKEEVFAEGLVRNVPAFSRFFDAMGYSHGELVNYSNIARDCHVDSKTVKEYFQILSDTLLGTMIEPYKKRQERQVIGKAPKFYLFDVGVAGALTGRQLHEARGEAFGRAFEHFILMELLAFRGYSEKDFRINYWRQKNDLETDFILGDGEVAVEVKGAPRVESQDWRGLGAFLATNKPRKAFVVTNERAERKVGNVTLLPWAVFLDRLWSGRII